MRRLELQARTTPHTRRTRNEPADHGFRTDRLHALWLFSLVCNERAELRDSRSAIHTTRKMAQQHRGGNAEPRAHMFNYRFQGQAIVKRSVRPQTRWTGTCMEFALKLLTLPGTIGGPKQVHCVNEQPVRHR